ncbi:histidinol dehydrogenase [Chloroflexota bacterium]
MKIIEGFELAKPLLSRQAPKEASSADSEEQVVRQIMDDVRDRGDAALREYCWKYDDVRLTSLEISPEKIKNARQHVDRDLISALEFSAGRIRSFHQAQMDGIRGMVAIPGLDQLIRPLKRVSVNVPSFRAPLPSSLLMTAIPAKVAGVSEVIVVSPPRKGEEIVSLVTLAAADIAGVDRVFSIGGAQAVAALAFGTEAIPRVDKICGPGNIWVTLAKKMVYGVVGIDGIFGTSDVAIIADETANPEYCAADLLAQAEHDPLASSILITTSRRLVREVGREIEQQLSDLPRRVIAAESLENRGMIAVVASIDEAIGLANLYAPEHLCLMIERAASYVDQVSNAGCIFVGEKSTVVLGDYVVGPSHVLPTGGTARFSSALNVSDFLKFMNVIMVDDASLKKLGRAAQTMASAEGLEAHARAVAKRLEVLG